MELIVLSAIPGMLADAVPICYVIVLPPNDKEELTYWCLRFSASRTFSRGKSLKQAQVLAKGE